MSTRRRFLGPCLLGMLVTALTLSASDDGGDPPTRTVRCQLHDIVLQDNAVNYDGVSACDSGTARIRATYSAAWKTLTSNDFIELEVHLEPGHTYEIDADEIATRSPKGKSRASKGEFSWGLAVVEDSERLIAFVSNRSDVTAFVDYPRPIVFLNELRREDSIVTGQLTKNRKAFYAGMTLKVRFWSSHGKPLGDAQIVRIDRLMSIQPKPFDIEFEIPGEIPDGVAATTLQVIDREVLLKREYKRRLAAR